MLFGLFSAEMEVGVKCLEILQADFEPAHKHSGEQLGELLSQHAKTLTTVPFSHLRIAWRTWNFTEAGYSTKWLEWFQINMNAYT